MHLFWKGYSQFLEQVPIVRPLLNSAIYISKAHVRLLQRLAAEILPWTLLCFCTSSAYAWESSLLLVNTESFTLVDEGDRRSDIEIRFGETLHHKLIYQRALQHFLLTDDLRVIGDLAVEGALSGASLDVRGTISGASLVAEFSFFGAGLTDCDSPGMALGWDAESGQFYCSHGGTASGRRLTVVKPLDEVLVGNQELQSDDDLRFLIQPGETWVFSASLIGNSREMTGFRFGMGAPAGSSCVVSAGRLGGNAAGVVRTCGAPVRDIDGTGDDAPYLLSGVVRSGALAGAVSFEWAQEKARNSATAMRAGSFLTAERVE